MLLTLTLIIVLITSVALAVYLEPMTALIWIGVLAVGQLMVIGLVLLNQRR